MTIIAVLTAWLALDAAAVVAFALCASNMRRLDQRHNEPRGHEPEVSCSIHNGGK